MMIGISHYCESKTCRVELFTVSVDDVMAGENLNCPGCGQFGRTKGHPQQTSRSIGTDPADGDPHR